MHNELTKITLLIPFLLQLCNCLKTPRASTLAGPVKSIDALAPVAIINASISLRELSNPTLSSNFSLNVSMFFILSGIIEFSLMICFTKIKLYTNIIYFMLFV